MKHFITGLLFLCVSSISYAEDLIMLRSTEPFPETMSLLQATIRKHGYTVSRVQRVDIGLSKAGYNTDKYRIVFFGKDSEIQDLLKSYPELAPYLPLKIVIYAEHGDTILVALNPGQFNIMYPKVNARHIFNNWERDMHNIFKEIRTQANN